MFEDIRQTFPAMNRPYASDDFDNPHLTDYSIGRSVIYAAFTWSVAEEAYRKTRELAINYGAGFYDVSSDKGEIWRP